MYTEKASFGSHRVKSRKHDLTISFYQDAVFADYYNAFLASPSFPLKLHYDHATRRFRPPADNAWISVRR